jgi:hypothetical protein
MIEFKKDTHEYFVDGVKYPSITQILKAENCVEHWGDGGDMARGTAVHQACQFLDENDLDESSLPEWILPYLAAYNKFLIDTNVEWKYIEKIVYNEFYKYAGTLDRTGYLNNRYCIFDIKTNASPKATELQLGGYCEALFAMDCKEEQPTSAYAIVLKNTGAYSLVKYNHINGGHIFKCLAQVYWWKINK